MKVKLNPKVAVSYIVWHPPLARENKGIENMSFMHH
jgi:hypothetical protein